MQADRLSGLGGSDIGIAVAIATNPGAEGQEIERFFASAG